MEMTQDEIIRMAREAGFINLALEPKITRFAALVAAHEREKFLNKLDGVSEKVIYETVKEAVLVEREACAKVCETVSDNHTWSDYIEGCDNCAAAIRARCKHG